MVNRMSDRAFNLVVYTLLLAVAVVSLAPMLYVISVSLTPYSEVLKNGGFILIPKQITLEAYKLLWETPLIPNALYVNVWITVVGTFLNMLLTVLMAYPLSRPTLPGRKFFSFLVVFTMIFNGGLIPTYMVVQGTGLLNTVWAMILPNIVWAFNLLVLKTFFEGLPKELFESARMDGAGEARVLLQIVIPLSVPAMLTVGMFYTVGHWNEFFQAVMYVQDKGLLPLQVVIRGILSMNEISMNNVDEVLPTTTLQMAAVVLASIPIIIVYPFIQKHFSKGMLLGGIKG
ncbi:carbohydrate ABC transporter permease [Paenibacillus mucilaginosus]|uniref:Binding-protein-dependent transport systems inner membrane component n=3 Tax=Paenibacillus mucilaginosus TaxID=61624 RepID=H6NLT4_9BACL|nr:carbohydrate ABC transporter permease [Paenibacillus mucilaginosus]AEI44072.1 binding-protein-dependent transport systems inner membrane component [Paenibacillus mucilaginosus KNP414]AFC31649.1 binding-protein-dependent transport systems inner membrane component [Paenibacillus mucilaginosus 3016]AFH63994.1 ABC transporter permease [Paenibacillus mucilaginosus K02]MCG7212443.1 carbohydrate ABC transporter permease [Paenibacillus mucilaginosus]WDM25518.1 carbohydrate ABC transporter permease 